jgi:hypothetical protein
MLHIEAHLLLHALTNTDTFLTVFRIRIDFGSPGSGSVSKKNPNLYKNEKKESGKENKEIPIKLSVCLKVWIRFRIFVASGVRN